MHSLGLTCSFCPEENVDDLLYPFAVSSLQVSSGKRCFQEFTPLSRRPLLCYREIQQFLSFSPFWHIDDSDISFYAVFDGHGGSFCSQYSFLNWFYHLVLCRAFASFHCEVRQRVSLQEFPSKAILARLFIRSGQDPVQLSSRDGHHQRLPALRSLLPRRFPSR